MKASYTINPELNGIEITFEGKPGDDVRAELKNNGFRWHKAKKLWYAKQTAERLAIVERIADGEVKEADVTAKAKPETPKKNNKYNVQVGDIFSASWGYEQTNNDFFQVVEVVGKSSVRVREVHPPIIKTDAVGPMAEDREYKITRGLLPPAERSVFIKDQVKGDLKRLRSYAADGVSNPQFYLTSYADAHYCNPGKMKTYESWYY